MRFRLYHLVLTSTIFLALSCKPKVEIKSNLFAKRLEQLKPIEGLEVLKSGQSMIAVSGPYQARVFASTSKGLNGAAYGYFNDKLIEENAHENNMAYLGGESRMWFAPEFGKYSIFFDANKEQIDENMRAPYDLSHVKFEE